MKIRKFSRRFYLSVFYAIAFLTGLWGNIRFEKNMHIRGYFLMLAVISFVLLLRSLSKLLTPALRRKAAERVLRILQKLLGPAYNRISDFFEKIGWKRKPRMKGKDEFSFVFRRRDKNGESAHRVKNRIRWQDQTDNRMKIRFLYAEYILRHIRNGYLFSRTMTPREAGKELAAGDDEKRLFALYQDARYDDSFDIADDEVENLRFTVNGKPGREKRKNKKE